MMTTFELDVFVGGEDGVAVSHQAETPDEAITQVRQEQEGLNPNSKVIVALQPQLPTKAETEMSTEEEETKAKIKEKIDEGPKAALLSGASGAGDTVFCSIIGFLAFYTLTLFLFG